MGVLSVSIAVLYVVLLSTLLQPYFLGKRPGGIGMEENDKNGSVVTPPWEKFPSPGPPGLNGEGVGGVYAKNIFHAGVGLLIMGWLYVAFPLLSVGLVLHTIFINTDFSYLSNPDPYGLETLEERSDLYHPLGRNDTRLIEKVLKEFKPSIPPSQGTTFPKSFGKTL